MTRVISPPTAVDVTLDHGRAPIAISGALAGSLQPIARWKVVLNDSLLCELFRDAATGEWFVERVYD